MKLQALLEHDDRMIKQATLKLQQLLIADTGLTNFSQIAFKDFSEPSHPHIAVRRAEFTCQVNSESTGTSFYLKLQIDSDGECYCGMYNDRSSASRFWQTLATDFDVEKLARKIAAKLDQFKRDGHL